MPDKSQIKEFISEFKESKTEHYDMLDEFNCLTLKILCRTAMGVDMGKENPETGSYDDMIKSISGSIFRGTFEKITISTDVTLIK